MPSSHLISPGQPRQATTAILTLCGSLRQHSRCKALLEATRLRAGLDLRFSHFESLGALPLFNPDLLEAQAPPAVQAFWSAVDAADVLLIASPEYAHGVTAVIKNALDWLVGHIPFTDKPVAVFNPSCRASHADAALKETLGTMSARLIEGACLQMDATRSRLNTSEMAASPDFAPTLDAALQAIRSFAAQHLHADTQSSCGSPTCTLSD